MALILKSKKVRRRDRVRNVEFEEIAISVNRVSKTVKGGRRFSFSTLVGIGNRSGHVGIGLGKSLETSSSKKKAIGSAKNNLYHICLSKNNAIPHLVLGKFGASSVLVRPAKPGTGIIAGKTVRIIFECLGVTDVVAKVFGSRNPHNVAKATLNALMKLKSKRYFDLLKSTARDSVIFSSDSADVKVDDLDS